MTPCAMFRAFVEVLLSAMFVAGLIVTVMLAQTLVGYESNDLVVQNSAIWRLLARLMPG